MLNNTYGKTMTVVGSVIGLLSLNRSYKIGMSIFSVRLSLEDLLV